jgi:hypothetical protein
VAVEIAVGFSLLRSREFTPVLGLTVGKAMGVGTQLGLALFGPLAGNSKIDQFSHATPRR